ncbi:unnamed protein product [Symbiodinium sp. CCMP2592]|nr:unnamed protein product [Symbiodinium sp. CCMP2592]
MLSVVLDGNVITSFQNCLLNGIANVEPSVDLQYFADHEGPLSAKEFNEIICFASQQPSSESVRMILEPMTDVLTHVCSKEKWLCHQQMSDGTGHWFAVVFEESGEVRLVDSTAGARRLSIAADGLASLCCQLSGLTWFQLRNIPQSIPMDNDRAYMLEGTATGVHDDFRVSFRTPLQHCVKCQSTLEVEHIPMRCTSKSCRIRHLYNYRKQGGKKLNTMQHDQMDVIFVNSNTAFAKEFLEYHDALQFRGCVSNNAIAWAQQEVLWQDENEHASWNQAYSIASLYYYMIREAEKMWARSTHAKDKLAAIDLDNPLTDAFMADYTSWWHKHQLTRTEHMSIREIVLDGHEKVATKCSGVALDVLHLVAMRSSQLDCVVYDSHAPGCPCSPLQHKTLNNRLEGINTSIAEQTFAWFRGYASQFNTKSPRSHAFYVLLYVQRHNDLTRQGYRNHLNPFSARKQAAMTSGLLKRPACKKYTCRRPASSPRASSATAKSAFADKKTPSTQVIKRHVKKTPATKMMKRIVKK